MKYNSRDEVGLLQKGSGGLVEVQDAVKRYDEQSPLYGFLHYRRRKVVLKFVPEGTSRLVKGSPILATSTFLKCTHVNLARVTVHFQSVTEWFSPHDIVFEFFTASELKDSALSSACSLHTASASLKSSSDSLPPRGLAGITEDVLEPEVDDTLQDKGGEDQTEQDSSSNRDDAQARHEKAAEIINAIQLHKRSTSNAQRVQSPSPSNTEKELPPTPVPTADTGHTSNKANDASIHNLETVESRPSPEYRTSSQSARPSAREIHKAYEDKPKVKLGPRPSMDSVWRSDVSTSRDEFRPVATLPAGLRMPSRKSVPLRPMSSQSHVVALTKVPGADLIPPPSPTPRQTPDKSAFAPGYRLPTTTKTPETKSPEAKITETKTPKMTPEKRKLMKALQLRQKQIAAENLVKEEETESPGAKSKHPYPPSDESAFPDAEGESVLNQDSSAISGSFDESATDIPQYVQDSPVSAQEPSEGHSTKASSVTDDGNIFTGKNAEGDLEGMPPKILDPASPIEAPTHPSWSGANAVENSRSPVDGDQCSVPKADYDFNEHYNILETRAVPAGSSPQEIVENPEIYSNAAHSTGPPLSTKSSIEAESVSTERLSSSTYRPERQEAVKDSTVDDFTSTPNSDSISEMVIQDQSTEVPLHDQATVSPNRNTFSMSPDGKPVAPSQAEEELGLSRPIPLILSESNKETSIDALPMTSPSKEGKGTVRQQNKADSLRDVPSEQKIRRHGLVSPIEHITTPDVTDDQFLSDDAFMEELKSATLQQAKPISVSKSPVKPVISRNNSEQPLSEMTKASRAVSSPLSGDIADSRTLSPPPFPNTSSLRSMSASHSQNLQSQSILPKKLGVSSGISQRIKALEQLSSRPASPVITSPTTTTTFINLRRSSVKESPNTPDPNPRASSWGRPDTSNPSPSASPEMASPDLSGQFDKPHAESISVTATIVRDSNRKMPDMPLNLSQPQNTALHKSPLVVEHQSMGPPPLTPLKPPRPRYARYSSARSGSSSSTDLKVDHPPSSRRGSFASKRSMSSRNGSDLDLPRSASDKSINSVLGLDGLRDERKDSKRSRLLKRMSSLSSMSRRSIAQALSPGPKEASIMEHHEPVAAPTASSVIDLGDLNIQFPDTLVKFYVSCLVAR